MTLIAHGSGAQTQITETPKKFDMPKMPRGMPKGRGAAPGKGEDD